MNEVSGIDNGCGGLGQESIIPMFNVHNPELPLFLPQVEKWCQPISPHDKQFPLHTQLPALFNSPGENQTRSEAFEECIAGFEMMAEACHRDAQTKLINLAVRLWPSICILSFTYVAVASWLWLPCCRAPKAIFSSSYTTTCVKQNVCGKETKTGGISRCLCPRFDSLVYSGLPQGSTCRWSSVKVWQRKSVLSSHFVTGLIPKIKRKIVGCGGNMGEILAKAMFEEAVSQYVIDHYNLDDYSTQLQIWIIDAWKLAGTESSEATKETPRQTWLWS